MVPLVDMESMILRVELGEKDFFGKWLDVLKLDSAHFSQVPPCRRGHFKPSV
jgi:hypothetical protein